MPRTISLDAYYHALTKFDCESITFLASDCTEICATLSVPATNDYALWFHEDGLVTMSKAGKTRLPSQDRFAAYVHAAASVRRNRPVAIAGHGPTYMPDRVYAACSDERIIEHHASDRWEVADDAQWLLPLFRVEPPRTDSPPAEAGTPAAGGARRRGVPAPRPELWIAWRPTDLPTQYVVYDTEKRAREGVREWAGYTIDHYVLAPQSPPRSPPAAQAEPHVFADADAALVETRAFHAEVAAVFRKYRLAYAQVSAVARVTEHPDGNLFTHPHGMGDMTLALDTAAWSLGVIEEGYAADLRASLEARRVEAAALAARARKKEQP